MIRKTLLAAVAAGAMMAGSAQAATIFSQDFSGPLGANESVAGQFHVGGGYVGHQGANYLNNETSSYQLRLDLRNVADAVLAFDFDIASEYRWDGFNVAYSTGGAYALLTPTSPFYGQLWGRAFQEIGAAGYSGVARGRSYFDLAGFQGQVLDLRLQFASDYAAVGRGVKIDNLLVEGAPVTSAVPEPATWAMMITGFGLAGGAIRSRRRNLLTTAA